MVAFSQRGVSLSVIVFGVAAAGAVVAAMLTSPALVRTARPTVAIPTTPETSGRPVSLATLLHASNLSPELLAAAGLSVADVTAVAARARAHLESNAIAIQHAVETHKHAQTEVERLERVARMGADGHTLQDLLEARVIEGDARRAKDLAVAGLHTAASSGIDRPSRTILECITSQQHTGLPHAFLTSVRSEAEVVSLRTALADQRIALRDGRDAPADCQAVIHAATDDRARAAQTNLNNLAAYREAWRTALTGL